MGEKVAGLIFENAHEFEIKTFHPGGFKEARLKFASFFHLEVGIKLVARLRHATRT